ncbi:MAG: arginase [Acidobacteria bacterium]|nr:arginase [Acidobacteriota bacterium]
MSRGNHDRKVKIIGVPLDLGAGRRGVDMGPSALRIAGIHGKLRELGYAVEDAGNIYVPEAETRHYGDTRAKYQKEVAFTCQELSEIVKQVLEEGCIPLVLGGDHSMAIGTIAGVSAFYRPRGQKIGLIWFDAHGDANTPDTTPSGNIHGMPLAASLGFGAQELTHIQGFAPKVDPKHCVLIGVRVLDSGEKEIINRSGIRVFTMRDVDEFRLRAVVAEAINVVNEGTAGFHVSMDMDLIDPHAAPGVGTPVRGGLTYREAHLAMEMIADSGRMLSFELAEVNPVLDHVNATAALGTELIASAFGKKIL